MAGFLDERAGAPGTATPGRRRHAAPEPSPGSGPPTLPSPRGEPDAPAAGPGASSSPVRPYFFTRGRTRAAVELEIETLVTVVPGVTPPAGPEHAAFELCREARSVAEVAATLGVPLGVARVLLGDLAAAGVVVVHQAVSSDGPALALLQRVLSGLRNL